MPIANFLKPTNTVDEVTEDDHRKSTPPITLNDVAKSLAQQQEVKARTLNYQKPDRWGGRSNAPYYREQYARVMQAVLDKMMHNRHDQMYYYKNHSLAPNSLYQKIQQSVRFLLDNLDPDGKYAAFWNCIYCHKVKGVGVRVCIRTDLLDEAAVHHNFMPTELITDLQDWRDKMAKYIEDGEPGIPFEATGLGLTEEQVADLEIQLSAIPDLNYSVTPRHVKLVKL